MGDQMSTWRTPMYIVKQAEVQQQVSIKWVNLVRNIFTFTTVYVLVEFCHKAIIM